MRNLHGFESRGTLNVVHGPRIQFLLGTKVRDEASYLIITIHMWYKTEGTNCCGHERMVEVRLGEGSLLDPAKPLNAAAENEKGIGDGCRFG
ncbi:hypothetical protein BT69DRAFT_1276009 [Atractiella rhizophila]|nr:hypothetical protein BT69DRAFT_1276009 [Atractiella rhizophila]